MAMHNLYWALQDLLKKYGLVRTSRSSGAKEVEVWVEPYEELKIHITAGRASKAEIKKGMTAAMRARARR